MILLIDHDDSFVHLLASYLAIEGETPMVIRDRELTLEQVRQMEPRGIVLSPGPGSPSECELATAVVSTIASDVPLLGVCLGHQVIAEAFGAKVSVAEHRLHGITSTVTHDRQRLFQGLPNPIEATRYHSLSVERGSLPVELVVTATADDGEVMGIRHDTWPIEGVQFHPESILTSVGPQIIRNWLELLPSGP